METSNPIGSVSMSKGTRFYGTNANGSLKVSHLH
jgi:hypothetical protein